MFAIMNIKTGKFVYGTNFNYVPHRQRTSKNQMLTYPTQEEAELAFKIRSCGKDYRIVVLKTIEVKRIIERINKK
jgi:hypothetical protein